MKRIRKPNKLIEEGVKEWIARYLNINYPQYPFFFQWDHVKLPKKSVWRLARLKWNNKDFVWPDLFVAAANIESNYLNHRINGIFLEVKRSRREIFKVDGSMRESLKVIKQNNSLKLLRSLGYIAEFVWSPETAKDTLDRYLKKLYKCVENTPEV